MSEHDHHDHHHDHRLITDRLPAGHWRVDPDGSEVLFKARTLFGLIPVNGEFTQFSGELEVDEDGVASGGLLVQTNSVSTGIARRDAHLRSNTFFGAGEYPQMSFRIESIRPSGEDHLDVTGDLAVREVTVPLAFTIYVIEHGDHLHVEGRADINHTLAGLGWEKPIIVSDRARADVALTLMRAD